AFDCCVTCVKWWSCGVLSLAISRGDCVCVVAAVGVIVVDDVDGLLFVWDGCGRIAVEEGVSKDNALLAGMLHDVADWKYNSDSEAQEVYGRCDAMLRTLPQLTEEDVEDVMWAIQRV